MFEDTSVWVCGHNLTGYLPESSPGIFTEWESARDSLLWELGDNGLADFYAQGLEQAWLDLYNVIGGEWTLTLLENIANTHVSKHIGLEYDEIQHDIVKNLIECDEVIDQVKNLEPETEFFNTIEHRSYWLEEHASLHQILRGNDFDVNEFDSAEDALEALAESMF